MKLYISSLVPFSIISFSLEHKIYQDKYNIVRYGDNPNICRAKGTLRATAGNMDEPYQEA